MQQLAPHAASGPTPASSEFDGLPSPRRWLAAGAIWLAIAMVVLDSSIANVALPAIARDFGARPADSIWIVNAYQLSVVVALLPLSALGERIGFRVIFRTGLVVFTLSSVACALSHSLAALTAARTLQGLGGAGVMSVNAALLRFTYPHASLGRGIGYNALVVSASAALGPTVASAILALEPWEWLFWVNIPTGLAALAVGWTSLPLNPLSDRRFDWISAAMNALTFGLVITGADILTRTRARLAGALELAAGLAVGWFLVRRELRQPRPLVPVDLLRDRMFALTVATSIASFAAQTMALVGLPFRFENAMGYSQVATGLLMTPWPVAVGVTAPIAGRLSDRLSAAVLCAVGLAVLACGLVALALLPARPGPLDIAVRMALCGAGFGLFQSPNNRMMLTSAPRERAGAAGGMLATARLSGQTIGAVVTAILLHASTRDGETAALAAAAACSAVGVFASLSRGVGPARGVA